LGFESSGFKFDVDVDGEEEATRVDDAPWVTITRRGLEGLDLVAAARVDATCSRGWSYTRRHLAECTIWAGIAWR